MTKFKILSVILLIFFTIESLSQSNNKHFSYIIKTSKPEIINYINFKFHQEIQSTRPAISNYDKAITNSILNAKLNPTQINIFNSLKSYYRIDFSNSSDIKNLLETIRNLSGVESVFPNYVYSINQLNLPNDSLLSEQWGLFATNMMQAWGKATGKGILVGVVDTGIDYYHPDLIGNLWINNVEDINKNGTFEPWHYLEIRNGISGDLNGIDDDGNCFIDDVIGFDFVNQHIRNIGEASIPDPTPWDEHSHGTAVSGVIAAIRNNIIGISGAAPNAKIVTIRVMDATGNGESDDIASGIVYGALNDVHILNFSFGEDYDSPLLHDAIKFAYSMGCVMIGSSGNNGHDRRHYPSDYEEVISVGSVDLRLVRNIRSNYGSRLDCVAPGVSIMSTQQGGVYKTFSGTSLAAPFVASLSAMLLELDSTLTPAEIKSIIKSTTYDIDPPGWDIFTGAGLVDALSAVNNVGKSNINITYPNNQQFFNKDNTREIEFIGSIITPMFDYYSIFIGQGDNPNKWDTLSRNNYNQIKDSTIFKLQTDNLKDTNYTLRIVTYLKNKKTLEKRVQFEIYTNHSQLNFTDLQIAYPYFNNRRILSISAKTIRPAKFSVEYKPINNTDKVITKAKTDRFSKYHSLIIDETIENGTEHTAKAIAQYSDKDSIIKEFNFIIPSDFFFEDKFILKNYKLPPTYMNNSVADLYNDGKSAIVINDFSDFTWGKVITFQFDNNQFIAKDTLHNIYIPAGLGDSNGDGLQEIMLFQSGKTFVTQAQQSGGNPFTNVIFQDTSGFNFWAGGFFDFTKDGKPEIIAYSDTSFMLFSYQKDKYNLTAQTANEQSKKYIGTYPGYAYGDFDGDGNIELAHSNMHGDIFIFKFKNDSFDRIFVDSTGNSDWNQFLTSADIDGDGKMELLQLNYGTNFLFEKNEGGTTLWQLRIFKYIDNDFKVIYNEYFYGVRAGIGYRNGILAGDLLNNNKDEIVLTLFPNLYIFSWDEVTQKLKPIYYYPYAFSNSGIIHDFDKNSINELGFCNGFNTIFIEYYKTDAPDLPPDIDGWALNQNTAYVKWQKVNNAEKYLLYSIDEDNQAELIAEANTNFVIITNLKPQTHYYFALRSFNSKLDPKFSSWSKLVQIYTNYPIIPIEVSIINDKTILLKYSGKISHRSYEPTLFALLDENGKFLIYPNTAQFASDSILLLSFNSSLKNGIYQLQCSSFPDFYRIPTLDTLVKFTLNIINKESELYLKNIIVESFEKVILTYSEVVITEQATDINNYILLPRGKIKYIEHTNRADAYNIYLDPEIPIGALGLNYTITVQNVTAQRGNKMTTGAGNTIGFVFTSDNMHNSFVYPNPFRLSKDEFLTFAMLSDRCEVAIMTLNGELIQTLFENDGNGGIIWNCIDKYGNKLKSGVYIYKVIKRNSDGSKQESEFKKFIIIN